MPRGELSGEKASENRHTVRISALDHEPLDVPVKDRAVIVSRRRKGQKVLRRVKIGLVTSRMIRKYGGRED